MAIKAELSKNEFLKLYRENEYVRSFSEYAVFEILDYIESRQEESEGTDLDWTGYFMEAAEYSADDILAPNNNFEVDEAADELIEIARGIDFKSDLNELLEDDEKCNDELWKELKDRLIANVEFAQEAASHIADEANLTGLDNDKWLKMY